MNVNLPPFIGTVVIVVVSITVIITLVTPGLFVVNYLISLGRRERIVWQRMEADLKHERRERAKLQLFVDRLLRQLHVAGVVLDTEALHVSNEELLYHQVDEHFDESELQELAYRLDVDYENLEGSTKRDKARSLSSHMERRDRMGELLAVLVRERPSVAW